MILNSDNSSEDGTKWLLFCGKDGAVSSSVPLE